MKEPKEGTKLSVEVIKDGSKTGLRIDLNGIGEDIIIMLVTAMRNEESVKDLILESAKQFMGLNIKSKLQKIVGDDRLGGLLKEIGLSMNEDDVPEKPYDFSGVEDLLTPEEKSRL